MDIKNIGKEIALYAFIGALSLGLAYLFFHNKNDDFLSYGDFTAYGVTTNTPLVVYSSEACPACSALKQFLKESNVTYVAYDFEKDSRQFQVLRENNVSGVPVVFINDTMIRGYNEVVLGELLKKHGLI